MASGLLASSLGASSIATGTPPLAHSSCYSVQRKPSFGVDSGGIRFSLRTPQLLHLPHPIKGIEGGSTCQESERRHAVNATMLSFEYEPQAQHPKSIWDSAKLAWDIFYRLNRPYVAIGLTLCSISASLLAIEKLSDLSPAFFIGCLQAVVTFLCVNTFHCVLNGLCDLEIDKINKPHLPLASGEMSFGIGATIVVSSFILFSLLALIVRSWPLFWGGFANAVLAILYNVDLPLMRWKKSSVLAATNIILYSAIAAPLGSFFHMQTVVFKRPATFPRQLIFSVAIQSLLGVVIALFKDIPDTEGDKKFGVQSLAARLGREQVFWFAISFLEMIYGATILVGTTSPFLWSKIVTGLGHAILASILWYRAKFVDLKSSDSTQSFYMFFWKLLCTEYFLVPLFR